MEFNLHQGSVPAMKKIDQVENWIETVLEFIITLFFGIILFTTIAMVILRYVFNKGIYGGNELISYLFVYTTALGAALSIKSNEHIRISLFVEMLPETGQKVIHIITYILIATLNTVLILLSIPWMKKVGSFESPTLRIPNAWVQFGVPLGCGFAVIFCIFRCIHIIRGRKDVASTD